ncbi:septum formation initiator [Hydrogenovibrio sp. SC-1]|uniref:FtsB family cell division protein n=1 Tax=Hydrogenovibrio sp. SC-1 TaxID=2065820 RepID=UPI000C7C2028|nr:septum formation initiator family protein [Hydrogenovibrio sp. SC-1]PLA73672.1 septum formation initiator [Hydrogenovibrio sp. SC-1]
MKFLTLAFAIVILILQVRLLSSDGGVGEWFALQSKLEQLQTQIQSLEKQNSLLKKEVTALQSNPRSIETLARQKLGMIAEDEVFIKVIELPNESQQRVNINAERVSGTNDEQLIAAPKQSE